MRFKFDLTPLRKAIEKSPELAGRGAEQATKDIALDWQREAVDIAPLDTGNLRKQIKARAGGEGLKSNVTIRANATQRGNGGRFNYAYYIHEGHMAADGKKLRHPGTEERFLEKSAMQREQAWKQALADEIQAELKKGGW